MTRRTPRIFVLSLLLVVLAGCSGDEKPTAPRPVPPTPPVAARPPAPPKVGQCYNLSFAAAGKPTSRSAPVPCTGMHSAETIFVGRLAVVEDGHLLAVDSDRVLEQISSSCPQRLGAHLGGDRDSRRLSRFQTVWFSPTFEQEDRGAVWYRCDLIALGGRDTLLHLPRHTRGVLDDPATLDRFGTCGTTSPTDRRFVRVACERPHSWRAVSTVDVARSAHYLGPKAAEEGDAACHDVAAQRANGALKFRWAFEWPSRPAWKDGQRYGYCWVPDGA